MPARVIVARNVLLDGRLALFHKRERWLAVADVHFGYEISQRNAGNLFPLWGMRTIEERLNELLRDYQPRHLLLLGDLVHDRAGAQHFAEFASSLRTHCEVIAIAGNHDRRFGRDMDLLSSWKTKKFFFHHGDCTIASDNCIQIIGHHHPAAIVRDGAGLRLKLPAFVQESNCWVLPAFSPWAAGTEWLPNDKTRLWLCSPQRILRCAHRGTKALPASPTRSVAGAAAPTLAPESAGC